MSAVHAVAVAVIFTWMGMEIAISFIEAPRIPGPRRVAADRAGYRPAGVSCAQRHRGRPGHVCSRGPGGRLPRSMPTTVTSVLKW